MKAPALKRRPNVERVITWSLAALAFTFVGIYGIGLVALLVRGGARALSFTTWATPLSDIEGEDTMRLVVGTVLFGSLAWAGARLVDWKLGRRSQAVRGIAVAAALTAAVAFRDHLPRFLISLPSETHIGGGVGPQIFNTLYFAIISTLITLPIGVDAAVYMARFSRSKGFVGALRIALDTLASLPSVVYGLFGFLVFVVELHAGYSLFAGAFVLSLLNLPLVVGVAEESLAAVPRELEDASLALGASQVDTVFRVTLPHAWPGIMSALVLSVGRVFAESAPLVMTAGTTVSRADAYSLNPFRGGETLAVHLWYVNSSGLSPDRAEVSAGTAAVLVLLILVTNMVAARAFRARIR